MRDRIDDVSKGIDSYQSPSLVVRSLGAVEMMAVRWLWRNRLARGVLTLNAGPPGAGKSTWLVDCVARTTVGADWPDGAPCERERCLLLSSEDDPARTLKPRVIAAGGDPDMITLIEGVRLPQGGRAAFSLASNIELLKEEARRVGSVGIIAIDVLNSFIGGQGIDTHRDADLRVALDPLNQLAAELDAAVIANTHFNKDTRVRNAVMRIMGSVAYVGAARDVWVTIPDPENDAVVWMNAKRNIAKKADGLRYRLTNTLVAEAIETARAEWLPGEITEDANEFLARIEGSAPEEGSALEDAKAWLFDFLSERSVATTEIYAAAGQERISKSTLRRAKDALKVEATKRSMHGPWAWVLPEGTFNREEDDHEGAQTPRG